MDPVQSFPNQEPSARSSAPAEPGAPPRVHDERPAAYGREWAREPRYRDPRRKSPAAAGLLSIMPGLGQVYVGYYQRGFIHIAVVGSVIALLSSETVPALQPLLGLFLPFFVLYNIVDAARRASLYNLALEGTDPGTLPSDFEMPGLKGSFLGGAVLVVFGVILLLHTRFNVSLDWLEVWWPVVPILFGAYLVYKAARGRTASS